jgi:hypothetical protein
LEDPVGADRAQVLDYAAGDLVALYAVEGQLQAAINAAGVGEFDANEIAVDLSDCSLYMYRPNAEVLFTVVRPILAGAECLRNTQRFPCLGRRPNSFIASIVSGVSAIMSLSPEPRSCAAINYVATLNWIAQCQTKL